jgi:hypothetical protein
LATPVLTLWSSFAPDVAGPVDRECVLQVRIERAIGWPGFELRAVGIDEALRMTVRDHAVGDKLSSRTARASVGRARNDLVHLRLAFAGRLVGSLWPWRR